MSIPPGPGLRILGLRLLGYRKNYEIRFTEGQSWNPLSLITGEISTGKTTILEFVDFCFGNSAPPQHPEVVEAVKAAQLSIECSVPVELDEGDANVGPDAVRLGYARRRFLIQRSVEGYSKDVLIFSGDLDEIEQIAPVIVSSDSGADESISKFLLQLCGLDGIKLRVAPTRPDSPTHQLSFRDTTPLWFLSNTRLDNKNLVFEHTPHKANKLRQVVDIVFEVFDADRAVLAGQVAELQEQLRGERKGIDALRRFIRDQGVPGPVELDTMKDAAQARRTQALLQLSSVDDEAREQTAFAEEARRAYLEKVEEAREAAGKARERETLLRRLAPLRAQYADDLKKLTMLKEAKRLFDPLGVKVCPACASALGDVSIVNGRCTLCRTSVPHLEHEALAKVNGTVGDTAQNGDAFDVSKELNSTKRRLNELNEYISVVAAEAKEARSAISALDVESAELQVRLNSLTREAVTPLLAVREAAVRSVADAERVIEQLSNQQRMLESVEQREREVESLAARLSEARRRAAEAEAARRDRNDMLSKLSSRFRAILESFGYPKLTEAEINGQLIPWVRGIRYDRVGSSGATTLISLAWELAIFELAYEEGRRHPGFLMIDSPQKNLAPEGLLGTSDVDQENPEAAAEAIVRRIYRHLTDWLSGDGAGAQIIIVDNVPPPSVEKSIVVRYSGSVSEPPYGLIDDASAP
ncbi:DNA recombination protein RecN [Streptomyces olivaceoviridis]|uniref:DNA recombination protein RecN n=1 Tax=Streptomyces olivaceoviridis TaxID=1921 RepID=UPI00367C41A1